MSERLAGMPRTWERNPTTTSRLRQPGRWFWILTVLLVGFTIIVGLPNLAMLVVGAGIGVGLVGVLVWVAWAVLAAWLVGLIDVYRLVPWSISLMLVVWGGFVATPLGGNLENVVPSFLGGFTIPLTAGLFEEGLKLLGVILVAALVPVLFRRPMGALICGMMAGVGFSSYENMGYTFGPMAQSGANASATQNFIVLLDNLMMRGIVNSAAAHMVFAGVASMGVVYFMIRTDRGLGRRWAVAIGFFLLAAFMHFLNDAPLTSSVLGQVFNNVVQVAVLVALIVHVVRAERRWLLGAAAEAEPVIQQQEAKTLRNRRARRRARADVRDGAARKRMKTMQWAQIGYLDAVGEGAPDVQTERLASYAATLRSPTGAGKIPPPRRPSTSEERRQTESPG